MERTLVITGKGRLSVTPDLATIKFPIKVEDKGYGVAVEKLTQIVNLLTETIESLGVEKTALKTEAFRVDTHHVRNKKTERNDFVGFSAQHHLTLEIPLDNTLLNKIVIGIVNLDQGVEFKISFGVRDKESCMQRLIENAIRNAKEKAAIIAKASDLKLKEIVNINYSFSDIYLHSETELEYDSDILLEYQRPMPSITPTDIDLSENVTVTWRIE